MGRPKAVGNGEGAIITIRRAGKIAGYAPEITIGWKDGARVRKRGPIQRTRGEARTALEALKRLHTAHAPQLDKVQRIRDYFPYWLTHGFTGRGRSVDAYRWAIDTVIVPKLGALALDKITVLQLDSLFAELAAGGLAPKSVQLIRTVLNQGYKRAIKWRMVLYNPVPESEAPKIGPSKARALTMEQAQAFLAAARGHRLELALRLTLALGLRRGEVCGLRWEDIDLEAGLLTVNGTLGWHKGKGLVYGPPKSDSGRRRFTLPASLLSALRRHRLRLTAERKAMGAQWTDSAYVFVATTHGGALNPSALYKVFRAVLEQAGLSGFRLHDLRHSCASLLNDEGVQLKTISAFLGHSDTRVTSNVYIHLFDHAVSDAAEVMENRLGEYDS